MFAGLSLEDERLLLEGETVELAGLPRPPRCQRGARARCDQAPTRRLDKHLHVWDLKEGRQIYAVLGHEGSGGWLTLAIPQISYYR